MTESRRNILNSIANALSVADQVDLSGRRSFGVGPRPYPVVAPPSAPGIGTGMPNEDAPAGIGPSRWQAEFLAALERQSTSSEVVESPVLARLKLAGQFKEEGVTKVMAWTAEHLPVPGILESLKVLGIEVINPTTPLLSEAGSESRGEMRRLILAELEGVDLGLTGADVAFANTGTVVLGSGPGRSRLVSQLARRHVVLLPVSRLMPTPEDWLASLRHTGSLLVLTQPANVALVSGPSRTIDIELSPALGVHGPRFLHVVLIDNI